MPGTTPSGHDPLTPAVFHVLVALLPGPSHGYAVMQRVEEESGTVMGPGTVYGSLQRLEEAGLIREVEEDGDRDRRRRFALTDRGRETLEREAVRLERMTGLLQRRGIGAS